MLGELVKMKHGKRRAWVTRRTKPGRLQGRFCVVVDAPAPKSAVRGVELMGRQFRGCFTSKADAVRKAEQLAVAPTLPKGKGKRSSSGSRKTTYRAAKIAGKTNHSSRSAKKSGPHYVQGKLHSKRTTKYVQGKLHSKRR